MKGQASNSHVFFAMCLLWSEGGESGGNGGRGSIGGGCW